MFGTELVNKQWQNWQTGFGVEFGLLGARKTNKQINLFLCIFENKDNF